MFNKLDSYRDLGIFILRLGIGAMFIYHGSPKMFGGVELWAKLGTSMKFIGVSFAPVFFGFMSAITEFGGGILLILGLLTRPVSLLLTFNMLVAVALKFGTGAGLGGASQALELAIVFFSLFLIGPGKYSVDAKFNR